jgi:predicted glutamine amidotransferase
MHNGGLGGWRHIKRRLGERLADKWYLSVGGGTDSEWAFALFLDTLERLGYDPSSMPDAGFGPTVLRRAVLRTIEIVNELIDAIPESAVHADNVDTRSLLNFAVTDGHSVICTRYVSSATDEAASLYYSSGTQWETRPAVGDDGNYQMERQDKGADIVLVASEPLTFERGESPRPNTYLLEELASLTPCGLFPRELGQRADQLGHHHPQPDCDGPPNHRSVLPKKPISRAVLGVRADKGACYQREEPAGATCHDAGRLASRNRSEQALLRPHHSLCRVSVSDAGLIRTGKGSALHGCGHTVSRRHTFHHICAGCRSFHCRTRPGQHQEEAGVVECR